VDTSADDIGWRDARSACSTRSFVGATAMFGVVLVALVAAVAVLIPIGPRTTGKSLDEINPT
jgi:hypothetical protein